MGRRDGFASPQNSIVHRFAAVVNQKFTNAALLQSGDHLAGKRWIADFGCRVPLEHSRCLQRRIVALGVMNMIPASKKAPQPTLQPSMVYRRQHVGETPQPASLLAARLELLRSILRPTPHVPLAMEGM